jgi:hypothetical protein
VVGMVYIYVIVMVDIMSPYYVTVMREAGKPAADCCKIRARAAERPCAGGLSARNQPPVSK